MSDHSIEGNTVVPAGLDVVPAVPGTFVGGHDMQGADGTVRTDRPGELLGTPVAKPKSNANSVAQADYIRQEVDRANREELPMLGGEVEDTWSAKEPKARKATPAEEAGVAATIAATRSATAAPARTAQLAPAKAADSQISVKPGIER